MTTSSRPLVRGAAGWLVGMLVVGGIYLAAHLTRGWFPHDEGALGQTAERVLQGEVPHRDFDESYTGLLTYVHAAAFAVGGIRLPVLRIPLFVAALGWLAALFAIARRSTSPPAAAAIALLALVWSVPNYPASMPSWYNLFCATWGVLALLRWMETRKTVWLVLAGAIGGVSFLVKLSGLFYVTGVVLFLVFVTLPEEREQAPPGRRPERLAALLLTGGLALLVAVLWRAIAPHYVARAILHFVVPGALLAAAVALREWQRPILGSAERLRRLFAAGPFLAGVALPVLLFGAGYAMAGALPALLQGVFVTPFLRLEYANMRPPAPHWFLAAVPLAILLRPRQDPAAAGWRRAALLAGVLLGAVLWLAAADSFPHRVVWQSIRNLIPVLALLAAGVIMWPRLCRTWKPGSRTRFVLLACVVSLTSLIQFPFSSPTYFLYVAPLLLLAIVELVQATGRTPAPLSVVTMAFYGAFAVLLVVPGSVIGLAFRYERPHDTVLLTLPRAGLRVRPEDAALYSVLIPRARERAGGGEIWAGPDAPEVYFLAGFPNRTRAIFDFLGNADSVAAIEMRRDEVRAVVLNTRPAFSRPLSSALVNAARARFPRGEQLGRFELRWRDRP